MLQLFLKVTESVKLCQILRSVDTIADPSSLGTGSHFLCVRAYQNDVLALSFSSETAHRTQSLPRCHMVYVE